MTATENVVECNWCKRKFHISVCRKGLLPEHSREDTIRCYGSFQPFLTYPKTLNPTKLENSLRSKELASRACRLMGWKESASPGLTVVRAVAKCEAIALSLDKLEEIVKRLESQDALQHACLAALGFLGGVSILSKAQLEKTLADAVNASGSDAKWSSG